MDQLQTVDDIPQLANLEVPPSKYISTRLGKPRRADEHQNDTVHDFFRSSNAPAHRTYAPFPLPYEVTPPSHPSHSTRHPAPPSPGSPPPTVQYEYPAEARRQHDDASRQDGGVLSAHQSQARQPSDSLTLPPLHALSIPGAGPSDRRYTGQPSSQQHSSHHGDIPTHYPVGHSQVQYGYPANTYPSPVVPPHHNSYYPPTPTSALTPQFGGQVYQPQPTPHISHGHPRDISCAAPQVTSQPTHPAHCHTSKYSVTPTMPVNQMYPESYPDSYPHATTHISLRQAPSSYTFVPQTSVEGQGVVRPPLSPPIDPRLRESEAGPACFPGMPAAAPSVYSASPTYRVRPSIEIASHAGCHPSESREDWEDAARHSPSLSPRSTTSSIGKRLDLAPLRSLTRLHPYSKPRDKFDDKALMAFSGRRNSFD